MSVAEGSISCARCGSANPAGSRFCNGCGARLEAAPPPQETRRTVTVLFVDVAGSTALGERLDPEPLRALIGQYFDLAKVVIERHGGTVEKFIGDAVMAVFGLPVLHEDDALRAVRAAHELQERLAASTLGDRIVTRIGVNTGPVVAADTEDAQRLVTGDAVNTAARLEQHAPPGGILLGAETHRLVRDAVIADEVEPVAAKGKAEPVRAWRLVSVDPAGEGTARRLDAPLVGRDRELKRLLRSYEDAVAERRCGLFTLLGAAGVGKSRLVFELVSRVRDEATVLRGRCLPYGEGITYWPVAEIVRAAAGIEEHDASAEAIAKIQALVAAEPDAVEVTDRIAGAIGLAAGDAPREEVFRAVRRLCEVLAARRPLLVVVDDLQWAEPTLLDLVEHIVDWSRGLPILVVALARPELLDARPAWGSGKLDSQQVLLEGLGADDVRTLATALLGTDIDAALLARVETVAEGNPLFVEQLVAMLIEDGHLVRDGAGWRATSDLAAIQVPPTISALLAARLDRLPADERHVAERASVVGRIFERTAVTELSPEGERDEVSARLRRLVRRELIRPDPASPAPDDTFRFRHILIRDAAYEALPKRDRADLHARFADWLERSTAGRLAEYEEIVGYHLDQAVRYRVELGLEEAVTAELRVQAADHLLGAGSRALNRTDPGAASRLLARAIDLGGGTSPRIVDAMLDLGHTYMDTNRFPEAMDILRRAVVRAEGDGDATGATRARLLVEVARLYGDPTATAEGVLHAAKQTIEILGPAGDDRSLLDAWLGSAVAYLGLARWAETVEAFEQALIHAERAGAAFFVAMVPVWLSNAYTWGPTPVEEALRRTRAFLQNPPSRRTRAALLIQEGTFRGLLGELDAGAELQRQGHAELTEIGLEGVVAAAGLGEGLVQFQNGDLRAAEAALRKGRDNLFATGETAARSTVEAQLAVTLAWLGLDDEAIEWSRSSEAISAADDRASQSTWRAARGLAFAHQSRSSEALELAQASVDIASSTDALSQIADHFEVLGEVLRLGGEGDGARRAGEAALEGYAQKGIRPAVTRLRAWLDALG